MTPLCPGHDEVITINDGDGHVERYREQGMWVAYIRDQLSER
ncbi:hypothetical protein [Gordonia sp. DT101]